jgi:chaperonin GroEL
MFKRSAPTVMPVAAPEFAPGARVVFQPHVLDALCAGADQVVDAIRPTLGPRSRAVLAERNAGRHFAPDILHDGGVIARRLIEFPDPDANTGAMLVRNALWSVRERAARTMA